MIKRFDGVSLWSHDLQTLLPFYRDLMQLPVALESPRFVILGDFENPRLCLGSHSEVSGPANSTGGSSAWKATTSTPTSSA